MRNCRGKAVGGVGAGEVAGGDLEVAAVEEAAVLGERAVGGHFLRGAAPHGVVGAFDHDAAIRLFEAHGAVLGVIGDVPRARACLNQRLVTVGVEGGAEAALGGVLIQLVGGVGGGGVGVPFVIKYKVVESLISIASNSSTVRILIFIQSLLVIMFVIASSDIILGFASVPFNVEVIRPL